MVTDKILNKIKKKDNVFKRYIYLFFSPYMDCKDLVLKEQLNKEFKTLKQMKLRHLQGKVKNSITINILQQILKTYKRYGKGSKK